VCGFCVLGRGGTPRLFFWVFNGSAANAFMVKGTAEISSAAIKWNGFATMVFKRRLEEKRKGKRHKFSNTGKIYPINITSPLTKWLSFDANHLINKNSPE
jgi:hypothetical protein